MVRREAFLNDSQPRYITARPEPQFRTTSYGRPCVFQQYRVTEKHYTLFNYVYLLTIRLSCKPFNKNIFHVLADLTVLEFHMAFSAMAVFSSLFGKA